MPSIIAICPYCRAGGVRARDTAVGDTATCPKCKSGFTVLPEENPPDWAANAQPGAASFSAPEAADARPALPDETHESGAMPDVTEPSPVVPAEPKPAGPKSAPPARPPAAARAVPGAAGKADGSGAPVGSGMVLALGALCLVGPAMVATLLPLGRYVGLALAAVGLAGGVLALGAGGRARLAGAAVLLHAGALVVLLFLPSWLGLDAAGTTGRDPGLPGPFAIARGSASAKPIVADDWLDPAKASWQYRDARVTLRRAAVGPAEVRGPGSAFRTTRENYLHLTVQVKHVGLEGEVPLPAWADGVVVTDANDQPVAAAAVEGQGKAAPVRSAERVAPGHSADVNFLFAAPPKSPWVRVRLPAAEFGAPDEIRFRVELTTLAPSRTR
jgi:hypothetical protein